MASKFLRRHTWWVKFQHPVTGVRIRESLETHDPAKAELLRQRIELEVALRDARFAAIEVPSRILEKVGWDNGNSPAGPAVVPQVPTPENVPLPSHASPHRVSRTPLDEALHAYLKFIRVENAPRHVENKISMLRRFIGTERTEQFVEADNPSLQQRRLQQTCCPFFTGTFLDEITRRVLEDFFEQLDVSMKTKRHYREFFHHFFKFCINTDRYHPGNWHCPNPAASLPSYSCKNRRIVYLEPDDVEVQLETLKPFPSFYVAAALMIYAGLRRAEALWLTRDAIAPDHSFLKVVNRVDHDNDIESSLKTGQRAVTVLAPLRRILEEYLPTLRGKWLVPSPRGTRWDGDAFARRLRAHNGAAGLQWTSLHFRHTYATQRAAQGWSLLRIATEMGNSVAIVTEFYAAHTRSPFDTAMPNAASELCSPGEHEGRLPLEENVA